MSLPGVCFVKVPLLLGTWLLAVSPVLAGYRWPPPPPPRVPAQAPAVVRPAPARMTLSVIVTTASSSAGEPENVVLHPGESMTLYWQPTTSPTATASRTNPPPALP